MHLQRFAALTLVLSLVWTSVPTHAQSSPDVDWASVLAAETDPRVEITGCGSDVCVTFPGSPKPNSGIAALDRVTYGDIVGDGGTEAVVPIDSGGSIGEIGSLIYMLDDPGTPHLVVAPGPGGNVAIDPTANELVSVGFDPRCSSLRCPNLVRTGYTLVSGALQQQDTCTFLASSADQPHPQGTCTPGSDAVGASGSVPAPTPPSSAGAAQRPCAQWDITGTWHTRQGGDARLDFVFAQSGATVTGSTTGGLGTGTFKGTLNGSQLDGDLAWPGGVNVHYTATITSGTLQGNATTAAALLTWQGSGPTRCVSGSSG